LLRLDCQIILVSAPTAEKTSSYISISRISPSAFNRSTYKR